MSNIFASDLHYLKRQRDMHRLELYKYQMNKCFEVIRQASTSGIGKEYAFFTVPYVMAGERLYDFEECMKYIKTTLKKHGFKRNRLTPGNELFISWESDPTDVVEEIGERTGTGTASTEDGVVIEYDPNDPEAEKKIRQEIARLRRLTAPS